MAACCPVTSRVSRTRRYPGVSGPDGRDAGLRIMGVIFADEVPHPREVMLIAIVDACGLLDRHLTRDERAEVADRLDLIRRLDLVGRAVFQQVEGGRDEDRPGSKSRVLAIADSLLDGLRTSIRVGAIRGGRRVPGCRTGTRSAPGSRWIEPGALPRTVGQGGWAGRSTPAWRSFRGCDSPRRSSSSCSTSRPDT